MAALDWSQGPAVESIPGKVSGAWVFKGTRLPVATVIENLEDLQHRPGHGAVRRHARADRGRGRLRGCEPTRRARSCQCSSSLTIARSRG